MNKKFHARDCVQPLNECKCGIEKAEAPNNDASRCEQKDMKAFDEWMDIEHPKAYDFTSYEMSQAWLAAIAWERSRNAQADERRTHTEVTHTILPSDSSEIQRLNSIIKESREENKRLREALQCIAHNYPTVVAAALQSTTPPTQQRK